MSAARILSGEPRGPTRAQRAAIVISLLGEGAARPLLEKLDDSALLRIEAELKTVSLIPKGEILRVAREFLGVLNGSTARFYSGKNQAKTLVHGIVTERNEPVYVDIEEDEDKDLDPLEAARAIWDKMAARPAKRVAEYLTPMTPNIIAKILRKLPPGISSEVLNALEEPKLKGVLEKLIQAEEDDPAMDAILARMVDLEFMTGGRPDGVEADEHLETVGEILSLISAEKRDSVFSFLEQEHENELISIQKSLFTVSALPETLNVRSIPTLFREIETTEMIRYLVAIKDIDSAVTEFLLSNISSRMAEQFRGEVDSHGKLAGYEVAQCERDFLAKLFDFKRLGKIEVIKKVQHD